MSERLPMMVRIGIGTRRTSVGVARIWSPFARSGLLARSMVVMRNRPFRWVSQMLLRFAMAARDLGVSSVT